MAAVNRMVSKEKAVSCLAKELVDIPMVLGHPFNEVVELLDEIADLQDQESDLYSSREKPWPTSSQQRWKHRDQGKTNGNGCLTDFSVAPFTR